MVLHGIHTVHACTTEIKEYDIRTHGGLMVDE